MVLPTLLFNLLSTFSYQTNVRYHYSSLIIPVFAWVALVYLRRVKDIGARRALVVMILLASLLSAYLWGPGDWSRQPATRYDPDSADARALAGAVALIPDDAVVACRSRISTHLAHRDKIYEFPTPFYASYYGDTASDGTRLPEADDVQYVLDLPDRLSDVGSRVFLALQEYEGFRQIYSKDGVVLLEKTPTAAVSQGNRATERGVRAPSLLLQPRS